jgi:phenylalanyl-tRNA synthetase beta subunit
MKVSYNWLKTFFDEAIPSPDEVQEILTMHSFEVESLDRVDGDSVLDIKVLPDRAHDCLSHWGIAKEVSVLTGIPLRDDIFHAVDLPFTEKVFTAIADERDTARLLAAHIRDIEVKESPDWLKSALTVLGQKPINNIVDITNYVMLAYGQPMHAYDTAKLANEDGHYALVSERAGADEEFAALDGKTYKIESDMLVIRDGVSGKTLGLAGIKGGESTKIDEKTTSIILEAANFKASLIRTTSQRLKLRTDASERFEKEIIPELALRAMKEAIHLILKLAGPGVKVDGISDSYPKRRSPYRIGLGLRDVERKLGVKISEDELISILEKLGCAVRRVETKDIVQLAESVLNAPYKIGASVSFDAPKVFDCSSLTAYLFSQIGYSIPRISVDQYLYAHAIEEGDLQIGDLIFINGGFGKIFHKSVEFRPGTDIPEGVDHVVLYVGAGEVIHASARAGMVVRQKISENENIVNNIVGFGRIIFDDVRYVVTVPLERLDLMSKRSFLVSGTKEDLIEEIGRVYGYENIPSIELPATTFEPEVNKSLYYTDRIRTELIDDGLSEVMTYAFVPTGEVEVENPLASDKNYLRASLLPKLEESLNKNLVNADLLGLKRVEIFEIGKVFKKEGEKLVLGIAVKNTKGMKEKEGERLKTILSSIEDTLGEKLPVLAETPNSIEVLLDEVIEKLSLPESYAFKKADTVPVYKQISPYPYIVRDLALFVDEGMSPHKVEKIFSPLLGPLCVKQSLFDSFLKTMPDGEKKQSYAWRFIFQSMDKTLTDAEVNVVMEGVYNAMKKEGFEVR